MDCKLGILRSKCTMISETSLSRVSAASGKVDIAAASVMPESSGWDDATLDSL